MLGKACRATSLINVTEWQRGQLVIASDTAGAAASEHSSGGAVMVWTLPWGSRGEFILPRAQ